MSRRRATGAAPSQAGWTRGPRQYVSTTRQETAAERFDDKLAEATRTHQHLWIAILAHIIDPPIREGTIFDADSLAMPPMVGCHICEQPYEPALKGRHCPGDPGLPTPLPGGR